MTPRRPRPTFKHVASALFILFGVVAWSVNTQPEMDLNDTNTNTLHGYRFPAILENRIFH